MSVVVLCVCDVSKQLITLKQPYLIIELCTACMTCIHPLFPVVVVVVVEEEG